MRTLICRVFAVFFLFVCAICSSSAQGGSQAPVTQLLPSSSGPIQFATTAIGGGTASVAVQMQLNQNGTLAINVPISANSRQEFSVGAVTGCVADGATVVSAGSTCSFNVTFTPHYPGQRSQPLVVSLDGQAYSFGLTGYATGPMARLDPTYLTTLTGAAGTSSSTPSPDNVDIASGILLSPISTFVDASNNVYIADNGHDRIRIAYQTENTQLACLIVLENPTMFGLPAGATSCSGATSQPIVGNIYTVAGSGSGGNTGDGGIAASAEVQPYGIAVDAAGNIFVGDITNSVVRVVYQGGADIACLIQLENPTLFGLSAGATSCSGATSLPTPGFIYRIAGTGSSGFTGNGGIATSARIVNPASLAVDVAGDVFMTSFSASTNPANPGQVRVIYNGGAAAAQLIQVENPGVTPALGNIYTVAGNLKTEGGDGTLATSATAGMLTLYAMAIDQYDNIYVADKTYSTGMPLATSRIRVIYNGTASSPNPLANLIALENPSTVASAAAVQPGFIYTIGGPTSGSGTGLASSSAAYTDGVLATASQFAGPYGLALDAANNIIIADRLNYTVRRISSATGIVTTIAGQPGASAAIASGLAVGGTGRLWGPWGISAGSAGGVFIVDNGANRIRVLQATGSSTYPITIPAGASNTNTGINNYIETNIGTPGSTLVITANDVDSPFGFLSPVPTVHFAGITECQTASATTLTVPSITAPVSLNAGESCNIGVAANATSAGTFTATATTTDNSLNQGPTTHSMYLSVVESGVTITLASDPATPFVGGTTQLTATLKNGSTPVTSGTVTFSFTGGSTLGTATLDPVLGTATITTSALTLGTNQITVSYPGATGVNPLFVPSTLSTTLTVQSKPAPTITIAATPASITAGSSATLTATVTAASGTPTGTVTITSKIGTATATTVCSTTALAPSGIYTCNISTLGQGVNTINASYGGDSNFAAATTTTPATVTVAALPTTTTVAALPATANQNQQVTLTATVSGYQTGMSYQGNVTFHDAFTASGSTSSISFNYGPVAVDATSGVATYLTTSLGVGTHVLTASFANDPYYANSASTSSATVLVTAPSFTITPVSTIPANGTILGSSTSGYSIGIVIPHGQQQGGVNFSVQSMGGYSGTVTGSCNLSSAPAIITCTSNPASLVYSGANTTQTLTVTINTSATTSSIRTALPLTMAFLLPGTGLLLFRLRRRSTNAWTPLALVGIVALALGAFGTLNGCGNSSVTGTAQKGTYSIPITVSDGTSGITVPVTVSVQ